MKTIDKSEFPSSSDLKTVIVDWEHGLLKARVFQDMADDCETCRNYYLDAPAFCAGGKCSKHGISCGYGFTCYHYIKSESAF